MCDKPRFEVCCHYSSAWNLLTFAIVTPLTFLNVGLYSRALSPPLDHIRVMVIVWMLRGNITGTALSWIVWHSVHSPQHTYVSSSYRSNRLGLSHLDPYAVHRDGCLELYYCNMVEWFWWDSSLISTTNWFPSVLWHCWFHHLAYKNRPRNDLWCVEWDAKPFNLKFSIKVTHPLKIAELARSYCGLPYSWATCEKPWTKGHKPRVMPSIFDIKSQNTLRIKDQGQILPECNYFWWQRNTYSYKLKLHPSVVFQILRGALTHTPPKQYQYNVCWFAVLQASRRVNILWKIIN